MTNPPRKRSARLLHNGGERYVIEVTIGGETSRRNYNGVGNAQSAFSELHHKIMLKSKETISMPSFNKNKNASAKTAPAKTAGKAAPAAAKRPAPKAAEKPAAPAKEKPVAEKPAKIEKAALATQVDIMAAVEAIIKEATGLKKLLANVPVVEVAAAAEKPAKAEKTEKAGKKPAAAAKDDDAGDDEGGDEGGDDDETVEFAVGQRVIAHYPADDDNEAADYNGEITKIGNKTGKVFVTIEDSDDVIEFTPEEAAEMLEIVPEKPAKTEKPAGKKEGVTKIDTTKKPAAGGEDKDAMIAEVGEKIHKLLKKVDPESPCFTKGCAHFVKNKKCSLSKMQNCLKDLSED